MVRQPNANGFISDLELNRLIHEAAYALYDLLVQARGELYYSTEWAFNTDTRRRYTLPANFYRLSAITICDTAGVPIGPPPLTGEHEVTPPPSAIWFPIPRMNPADLAKQENLATGGAQNCRVLAYSLTGRGNAGTSTQLAQLALYPKPQGSFCINLLYIPTLDLSSDSVTTEPVFDGINGWEEYIVYSVASTVAEMQEESNGMWLRKRQEVEARIARLAPNRDRAGTMQVADTWHGLDTVEDTLWRMR